jgi:hypothetical protein
LEDAQFNTRLGNSVLTNLTNAGVFNAGGGYAALSRVTSGSYNTAFGADALNKITTGSYNIALGQYAGSSLAATATNNIDIGNVGGANDSGVIRIGTQTGANNQTATYIAGINNSRVTGSPVFVTSSGQLGVLASSERYKTDIRSLEADTVKLTALRPVTFHLKTEPSGTLQYGLIAEEVDKVYPELVIRDADGTIQGVRYDELAPLLLSAYERDHRVLVEQQQQLAAQAEVLAAQAAALTAAQAQVTSLQAQMADVVALKQELAELRRLAEALAALRGVGGVEAEPVKQLAGSP